MHDRPVFREFEEARVAKVWDVLKTTFHFNVSEWKKEYESFLGKQPRNTDNADAFLIFGSRFIEPILNQILKRRTGHPTWNKLIDHVINSYPSKEKKSEIIKNQISLIQDNQLVQ